MPPTRLPLDPLSDAALLEMLRSENSEAQEQGWKAFLHQFSNLFLKIIWHFEGDIDAVMEKYVYVCAKLAENNFSRLRKFLPDEQQRPVKLSTWLTVVVKNLCREHHRVQHGRRRHPRALKQASPLQRAVFELYYWKGFTLDEIEQALANHPARLNGSSIAETLREVEDLFASAMPARQPPQKPQFVPFDDQQHAHQRVEPANIAMQEKLLGSLEPQERLVVRLRYWEDLSAPAIAQLLQLPSPRKVYTVMHRALKKIRAQAQKEREW